MNYIPEIVKMLGVEIGEEFRCIYIDESKDDNAKFVFNDNGLFRVGDDYKAVYTLDSLISGRCKIEKAPWKPGIGMEYYYVSSNEVILNGINTKKTLDAVLLKYGNCYRTEEEAKKHIDEWVKWYHEE